MNSYSLFLRDYLFSDRSVLFPTRCYTVIFFSLHLASDEWNFRHTAAAYLMMRSFLRSRSQSSPLLSPRVSRIIVNRLIASVLRLTYAIRNLPVDETAWGNRGNCIEFFFEQAQCILRNNSYKKFLDLSFLLSYFESADSLAIWRFDYLPCASTFAHLHKSKDEYRPFIHRSPSFYGMSACHYATQFI